MGAKADEKRSKELKAKERSSKERTNKERAKKAERNHKEKANKKKERDAKGAFHKKNAATHESHAAAYKKACNKQAGHTANAGKSVAVHKKAVKKAVREAKTTCKREKKRRAAAKERRAKLDAHGPTFNFKSKPCKGGKGSFTRKMKHNERVTVGLIPANTNNVLVKLRTDKDVDAELWTANGKREIAIIAWMIGKISSPTKASIKFNGAQINYSGYNGITKKNGMNFGHEDIGIKGKCSSGFTMKAYAFQAGVAKIKYSWGADPVKCKAAKAKKRKEKKAKHDAKNALKKKMKEGKYKNALKVLAGGKGCAGANDWTKASRGRLSHAQAKHNAHKAALAKCHTAHAKARKNAKHARAKERSFKKKHKHQACKSEWKCLPGISTPVRLDAKTGHVSCMSSQGKHCWWGKCRGSKVPRHPKNIGKTSLICGAHHKSKWGGTGYGHKHHWCNKAKKGLGFTGKPCSHTVHVMKRAARPHMRTRRL